MLRCIKQLLRNLLAYLFDNANGVVGLVVQVDPHFAVNILCDVVTRLLSQHLVLRGCRRAGSRLYCCCCQRTHTQSLHPASADTAAAAAQGGQGCAMRLAAAAAQGTAAGCCSWCAGG